MADSFVPKQCRFYEDPFPSEDDLVMVQIDRLVTEGGYALLVEYNRTEGMIQLAEVSARRMRSVTKHLRAGSHAVCMVLRVDREKQYIDLSKKRVSQDDVAKYEIEFGQAKLVHSLMYRVATQLKVDQEEVCKQIAWPLYAAFPEIGAYGALAKAVHQNVDIFAQLPVRPPQKTIDLVLEETLRRFTPTPRKLICDVEVICMTLEGVLAIKRALIAGREASLVKVKELQASTNIIVKRNAESIEFELKAWSPPKYRLSVLAIDKEHAVEILNAGSAAIKEQILKDGGTFQELQAPVIVGRDDGEDFATEGEKAAESSSDSGSDSEEDDTMGDVDLAARHD